jgi:DNA-directed RNA polymerase specialized sigma subunit
MEKKLRLFKGNREQDIYDVCVEKRPIDINGELMGEDSPDPTYEGFDDDEWLRLEASVIVREITDDPVEHRIADLILDYGYTEKEVAKILNISPARIEWLIKKIEAWKREGRNSE